MSSRAVVRSTPARSRVSARAAVLVIVVLTVLTFAISPLRALLVERDKLGQLEQQTQVLDRQNGALRERILHLQDPAYLGGAALAGAVPADGAETAADG